LVDGSLRFAAEPLQNFCGAPASERGKKARRSGCSATLDCSDSAWGFIAETGFRKSRLG